MIEEFENPDNFYVRLKASDRQLLELMQSLK